MADNYLEKRQAQLNGGKIIYRKDNPSLETLLHRIAQPVEGIASIGIKAAQLEAIARAAKIINQNIELKCSEENGNVSWSRGFLSERELGEVVLAMKLKACELGFRGLEEENSLKLVK